MLREVGSPAAIYPACTSCGRHTRLASLKADVNHPYRLPVARFACECGWTVTMPWRPANPRFAVMDGERPDRGRDGDRRRDYVVTTKSYGRTHSLWRWDIQRRSKTLGIRFYDDGFETEKAAKLAGEKALTVFLDGLRQEEGASSASTLADVEPG